MTPEQQVQDLHEAIACGRATLDLFAPKVLPRWRPDHSKPAAENNPPPGSWISAEDLQPADFLPGDYEKAAAAVFCKCGESGTATQVSKTGWVVGGMKCRHCDFFAPVLQLEGWDPSWALQFKMLREYAASRMEQQLEQEWASAHARIVGDRIRGMGVVAFAGLTLLIAVVSLGTGLFNLGVAVVKRSRCLVGEHNPKAMVKYDPVGAMLHDEQVPVKITCCEICRKELT